MKKFTYTLLALTIILLIAAGYLRIGARLLITAHSVTASNAAFDDKKWVELYMDLADDAFQGEVLSEEALMDAAQYEFRTYTIRLRNIGMLKAEWISIEIAPTDDDVISYGEDIGYTLFPYSSGNISATIVSKAETDTKRTATIRYYVYGRLFEIKQEVE